MPPCPDQLTIENLLVKFLEVHHADDYFHDDPVIGPPGKDAGATGNKINEEVLSTHCAHGKLTKTTAASSPGDVCGQCSLQKPSKISRKFRRLNLAAIYLAHLEKPTSAGSRIISNIFGPDSKNLDCINKCLDEAEKAHKDALEKKMPLLVKNIAWELSEVKTIVQDIKSDTAFIVDSQVVLTKVVHKSLLQQNVNHEAEMEEREIGVLRKMDLSKWHTFVANEIQELNAKRQSGTVNGSLMKCYQL
ncbi:hypothetical protein HK100_011887 [Physocladia obscura]|uniref:Uncharacterized protein n=1 Tax=Physocladia obscura TaxID=109957 RepID=A0AAD5T292_9FUNG|nr:hypothetical protein HK100_011887 [Physocladia obscura]